MSPVPGKYTGTSSKGSVKYSPAWASKPTTAHVPSTLALVTTTDFAPRARTPSTSCFALSAVRPASMSSGVPVSRQASV